MNCVLFTKMDQVFSKENKTQKILEKSGKGQGILSVWKSGNPGITGFMDEHFRSIRYGV